ncbi:abortive infection protein [Actinoplanes sp. GCM10030250]|uniref:abortive infection protein n=1 Tax=Actinoplanes sp. GCM10030250 TaxID=3273376 RepID=UPI0036220AE6
MRFTRAEFLGLAAAASGAVLLPQAGAEANATRRGLALRGVVYEVGDAWSVSRMRHDIRAVRHDLHASSVKVTGSGADRLAATAAEAAEQGLHVWLEPTLGDRPAPEILEHLAETGRAAERLRRQGAGVHLSVGCEFVLFVPGIVPGDTVMERVENLLSGNFDPEQMRRRLHRFTAKAAAVGRSVFQGRMTYAAADDEDVDWDLFDIIGIDYYGYFEHHADYVRDIRRHIRPGKPLAIMEFGTCTFKGAPEQGGMGWNVVDYTKEPPEIKGDLERSERTQARYLASVLAAFESLNLYSALAYTFVTPESEHHPDPRYDLDMASYAIVKPIRDRPGDPASDWHWSPKEAFHTLARAYGRAR